MKLMIHGLIDASKLSITAAVYLIVMYDGLETFSKLLVAKLRIAPKEVSVPQRTGGSTSTTKLMRHVKETFQKVHETSECHGWADSTIFLYWLPDKGAWSTFARNRTQAIKKVNSINVSTKG